MSDYYDILGVSRNATIDEIKKAYRKEAMQHHPDRGGDEAKFKQIQEAYDVLSDETKKSNYDRFGNADSHFGDPFSGFSDFFSAFGMNSPFTRQRKAPDVQVGVKLTLEEIVRGANKRVHYRRKRVCKPCSGTGGLQFDTCHSCKGMGQNFQVINTVIGQIRKGETCARCSGKGKIIKEQCKECFANGVLDVEEVTDVTIPFGCVGETVLAMNGAGNEAKDHVSGDLHIVIEEDLEAGYTRQGLDIIYDHWISISDAVLGTNAAILSPVGDFNIQVPNGCDAGKIIKIKGKGIPGRGWNGQVGDFLIRINLKVPKILTQEQKQLFQDLKNIE